MHLNRCPVCKTKSSLMALAQDEAQRELLGIMAKLDVQQGAALLGYLSLFASEKRDLANDKALKLAKEVSSMSTWPLLCKAMTETVESLRSKQEKPLKNHNYLKQVLASVEQRQVVDVVREPKPNPMLTNTGASKMSQALQALEADKGGRHG